MRGERFAQAKMAANLLKAAASSAVLAGSPAVAAVVYVYGDAGQTRYIYVAPTFVTQDTDALAFDACAPNTCISVRFDAAPAAGVSRDRLFTSESNASGSVTYFDDYAAGTFGRAGIHRAPFGGHTLSIADVGSYAAGSVLYLLDTPVGIFSHINRGLLTGDSGPLTPYSCLYTAGYVCGSLDFDLGAGSAGAQDIASVALSDGFGSDFSAQLRFAAGAFAAPGIYYGSSNTRLLVAPLPGGAAVPEPAAWALLISGFAIVGGLARARRREWGRGSGLR